MTLLATTRRVLARTFVHLYPSEWQARYRAGLLETIGARRVTWRDVADVAWCGVDEWSHTGPERNGRTRSLYTLRRAAVAIGAGYVVAAAATALYWSLFVIAVAAIARAWHGLNPLWVLRLIDTGFAMRLSVWFLYSLLFALPAVATCTLAGIGRRWTLAARLLTTASFASFTVWLPEALPGPFPVPITLAVAVMTGWVLAMVLFPARRAPDAKVRSLRRFATGRTDGQSADPASSGHPPHTLRAFTS